MSTLRRTLSFLFTGLIAVVLLTAASLTSNSPASAATTIAPTTTCANGVDNSGGLGMICRVTIINTITASGSSATVTVRECHGAAGDPNAACFTHTLNLGSAVTNVNQCNGSINGGGGTLRCRVKVTNRFIGLSRTKTEVTVNQCVGSGNPGAHTSGCDPFPASTTGATVTQCNGSANGDTLVGLTCTVTGTQTSSNNYVHINQCNGSANGGGALVICSASITNVIVPAATPRVRRPHRPYSQRQGPHWRRGLHRRRRPGRTSHRDRQLARSPPPTLSLAPTAPPAVRGPSSRLASCSSSAWRWSVGTDAARGSRLAPAPFRSI